MKRLINILSLTLLLFFIHNSIEAKNVFLNKISSLSKDVESDSCLNSTNTIVYVCMGDYSKKYHNRSNCTGLNNCQGELYSMDQYSAINTYNRTACCVCYSCAGSGGGGNSKDDNALGYVALAVIAASAAILSNDLYVYPVISFKGSYRNSEQKRESFGWAFGFRKTFKRCALEYGASYFNISYTYNNWNSYQYYSNHPISWGAHLNFVHDIFYYKTPDWIKPYAGVTINSVFEIGYGAIIGTQLKIKGRLSFDTRYEISSQTNQLQAGLIFKYQKKYLWQK